MLKPRGIIPALVTPLDENGNLLEESLRNVIDYTIDGGVHAIFALGSTGEIYALDSEQQKRVIQLAIEHTAGRVPVYAGASVITTRDCIKLAQFAEAAGADAISVLTPYFMTPSQDELKEHYMAIARSVKIPMLLYNNPGRTGVNLSINTIEDLSKIENIVGIKDSSGNMTNLLELIRLCESDDFSVIVGRDTLIYSNLAAGGSGAIAATANVVPKLIVGIYNACMAGDYVKAKELQKQLAPLRIAFELGSFPVVIKEALRMVGIDAGVCMKPVTQMKSENYEKLKEVIINMGYYNPL